MEDLRRRLKDLMVDDEVNTDKGNPGATVEHMRLPRNPLEKSLTEANATNTQFQHLSDDSEENTKQIAGINLEIQEMLGILKGMRSSLWMAAPHVGDFRDIAVQGRDQWSRLLQYRCAVCGRLLVPVSSSDSVIG